MRLLCFIIFMFIAACGVKGDPVAPETPTEIGRGRPTYQRALRKIPVNEKSKVKDQDEDEDEDNEK